MKGRAKVFAKICILFLIIVLMAFNVGMWCPSSTLDPVEWNFDARIDGQPWEGPLKYTTEGPRNGGIGCFQGKHNYDEVPYNQRFNGGGYFTVSYVSGGPQDALFIGLSVGEGPRSTGPVEAYLMSDVERCRFYFASRCNVEVNATLDGVPWSGGVNYTIQGPGTESGSSAPQSFAGLPVGKYTVSYDSGGPPDATLSGISATEMLTAGKTATFTFTLDFISVGEIAVNATLDGATWSGEVSYTVQGPRLESGASAPQSFTELHVGTYDISYDSGGPQNTKLSGISPSATEELSAGEKATFTLDFISVGDIAVKATLDGAPWSGGVSYTVRGPETESGSSALQRFVELPIGTYTISYNSGGPPDAKLSGISPSTTEELSAGETATFTLDFISVGDIVVNATLNGIPWSGGISYTIQGPGTESASSSAPQTFSELPTGTYIITYDSGGPLGATLSGISPSTTEELSAGETATFTFDFISVGEITVKASLNDEWWQGTLSYLLEGPAMVAGSSVPQTFTEIPTGTYVICDISGGPEGARFFSVWPSNMVEISAGETATFTLIFVPIVAPDVADLSVTKTVDNPTPNYLETITYTITVSNSGPDAATGIQVTDILPGDVSYVSSSPSQGTYSSITGIWDVGSISNGASATLQISATVQDEDITITNTAELTAADQTDPDSTPNNNVPAEDDQDDASVTVPF